MYAPSHCNYCVAYVVHKRSLRHFPQADCTNFRHQGTVEWLTTLERRQKRPTLGCPFERHGRIGGQSGRGGHYISAMKCEADRVFAAPVLSSSGVRFLRCRFSDQVYVTGHQATWPPRIHQRRMSAIAHRCEFSSIPWARHLLRSSRHRRGAQCR